MERRKEKVEGRVRHSRANFLVPVPPVRTLDELKAGWEESCRGDLGRRPRGQGRRKEALSLEDGAAMRGPPEAAFDASRVLATRAGNLSLVRFDGNDHSVPVRCAHREVVAKGDCERVRIHRDEGRVAEHRRIWEKERGRFDPVHYLALLEKHSLARLKAAVVAARQLGCPRKELIERYLYGEDRECATFRLEGRKHLKGVNVGRTDPGDHTALLEGNGGGRVRVESNRLPAKAPLGKAPATDHPAGMGGRGGARRQRRARLRGFFASTHRVDRTRTESRPAAHQEREVPGAQDAG